MSEETPRRYADEGGVPEWGTAVKTKEDRA
jgi:hypothetical protein